MLPMQDSGGETSLRSYMTLPVEQYFVLDPSQIRHIGANRFLLYVPRINVSECGDATSAVGRALGQGGFQGHAGNWAALHL